MSPLPSVFILVSLLLASCISVADASHRITPVTTLLDPSPSPKTSAALTARSTRRLSPTALTAATATNALLACWSRPGRDEDGSLSNPLLPQPLEYRLHLPPCYDEEPDRRYPVLYLIHGQYYTNDQWDRLGADETSDRLVSAGEISPFILVLPRDRTWTRPTKDKFGRMLVEDLIPYIDEHYRTLPDRSHRAIGGLSRGASWSVHLGLSHWELFGALGAHSLAIFWEDGPHIRSWLAAIPSESMPRIFLDTGENDYLLHSTLWFEGLLDEEGIPHEWYLFPGTHEEAYWQAHIEQYLRWYAAGW